VVNRLAKEMAVDVASVGRCLQILQYFPCVLAAGEPIRMLAWSPRRRVFRASFDTGRELELDGLTTGQAGIWLMLLAAEIGCLPDDPDDWMLLRLDLRGGINGDNTHLIEVAEDYNLSRLTGGTEPFYGMSRYDRALGQALWWCIAHRLR
jgi:hypothetical protein